MVVVSVGTECGGGGGGSGAGIGVGVGFGGLSGGSRCCYHVVVLLFRCCWSDYCGCFYCVACGGVFAVG